MVTLRLAKPEDAQSLYEILEECSAWLRARNVEQWRAPYPRARFDQDVARGLVCACEHRNEVVGTVTVHSTTPDYYEPDAWTAADDAYYFSQLAIRRALGGNGYGRLVVEAIERKARALGRAELRIDVVPTNPFLLRYYEVLGFERLAESTIKGSAAILLAKRLA